MKKTILALGIVLVFASCGGSESEAVSITDSTTVSIDTTILEAPTQTVVADSSSVAN